MDCSFVIMYLCIYFTLYFLIMNITQHVTCIQDRAFFCQILEFMIGTTPYRLSHFLFETMKQKQQILIIINFF